MNKVKILIADDHDIVIQGIEAILSPYDNFTIVAKAKNGQEALELLKHTHVDIALLDIDMPIMNGIQASAKIKKDFPQVKIIILSMHSQLTFILELKKLNIDAYVLKNRGKEELPIAIEEVMNGNNYFQKEISEKEEYLNKSSEISGDIRLTKREIEILKLISQGMTSPQISEKLFIAISTVDTHRKNLIAKTGMKNSKALVGFAYKKGLIE